MRKVVVLDDNADILQVVTEVLVYEGFEVHGISAANDLLPLTNELKPDLVLLDFKLSDGNGGELCRSVKAHPELKHIPVVIFTAYLQPAVDLYAYGCDAIIPKPFDLDQLIGTIQELTETEA